MFTLEKRNVIIKTVKENRTQTNGGKGNEKTE